MTLLFGFVVKLSVFHGNFNSTLIRSFHGYFGFRAAMGDIPVPVRLRRAILQNDALLVRRIVKNYPKFMENPDHSDKGNTSLHLAATLGYLDVIKALVSCGHDSCTPQILHSGYDTSPGISVNADSSTSLHLAAAHSHTSCVDYLCRNFPQTVDRRDKNGATPLMLAARDSSPSIGSPRSTSLVPPQQRARSSSNPAEDTITVVTLLRHKASVGLADESGNTALHYASAWGNLKVFRLLVSAGAPPVALNKHGYTAADYASTLQATAYCRTLVSEYEQLKVEEHPQPLFWQQHPTAQPQSQQQQQQPPTKLKLKISESDLRQPPNAEPRNNPPPVSPTDSRRKPGLGGLSRVPNTPPNPSRLVIQDDNDSDDEAPLTARKVSASQDDVFHDSYDSDR